MTLNDSILEQTAPPEHSIFSAANVKARHFRGPDPTAFRILPAYKYQTAADGSRTPMSATAYEPFRRPDGTFTDWGAVIQCARGVGQRADNRSGRPRDLVSPLTFDAKAYCPITALYQVASQYPEWQYLIEDQKAPDRKTVLRYAALPKVTKMLVMNIVDVGEPQFSGIVQLGVFTKSAFDSLFRDNGLAVAPSVTVKPDEVAQNYIRQWAYGDITSPSDGIVLLCHPVRNRRGTTTYQIEVAPDAHGNSRLWPLDDTYLPQRYDLGNLQTLLKRKPDTEIIKDLMELINMRSPTGRHEWNLLKEVFGHMVPFPPIPDYAPAAAPTIQSGFTPVGRSIAPSWGPATEPTPLPQPANAAPPQAPASTSCGQARPITRGAWTY